MKAVGFDFGSVSSKGVLLDDAGKVESSFYARRGAGDLASVSAFLEAIRPLVGDSVRFGVAGCDAAQLSRGVVLNALVAIARGVAHLHPRAKSVIEIGGHTSKFLVLESATGEIADFATNEACAAGTGSFLEQQAKRMTLTVEELAALSMEAKSGATIAGRCSVFAKSDMIHLQQKGTPAAEIAFGLCLAISRNAITTLLKGRDIATPVVIAGGCGLNAGVFRAFGEILDLRPDQVLQSSAPGLEAAIGAALAAGEAGSAVSVADMLREVSALLARATMRPATLPRLVPPSNVLRRPEPVEDLTQPVEAFLGIDLGSVSTDLVLLDRDANVISSVYLPTRGQPVDVLLEGLALLKERCRAGLTILGCGTTGSGRHLAAQIVGADVVKNEITCQALGARRFVREADTILEIGGQDSKFISLRDGAIADFTMNKICAAGTGSFLEEQAREIGIDIIRDFSREAFSSDSPIDLGSRCTVFMETEVVNALARRAQVSDISAGLAHSIVKNYLEKVVGNRRLGEHIIFQGGVASNDAVVSAFRIALDKPVHVHPYNRISGAIGAAIAAIENSSGVSTFRSDATDLRPSLRSFECALCSNSCEVNIVDVEGRRTFFGDTCERYTSRGASLNVEDLPPNLAEEYVERCEQEFYGNGGLKIGIPRASTLFGLLPFWATFFRSLGHTPVLSGPSSEDVLRRGLKHLAVGVCLPIKLTAGHAHSLLEKDVDLVFVPAVVLLPGGDPTRSYSCPYAMAVPFIIRSGNERKFLSPVISLENEEAFLDGFAPHREVLGANRMQLAAAFREAIRAQEEIDREYRDRAAALIASRRFRHVFAVLGKPYNTLDGYLNLSLVERLRRKGVLAIPQKFLPIPDEFDSHLQWRYSADMHEHAAAIAARDDIQPVIVSNFGCGPDAFSFRHVEEVLGSHPFLMLEFDEHRGEAGLITRVEAFIDQLEAAQGSPRVWHPRHDHGVPAALPPRGATVRIPYFADHAYAFSGALRFLGCDARVLPLPSPEVVALGEKHSLGKECHAYSMIAGDLIELSREMGDREVVFYFPGTSLPCLLREYGCGMEILARDLGLKNLTVSTPSGADLVAACSIESLERFYLGLMSIELLVKAVCQIRPYEKVRGLTDAVHRENLESIETAIESGDILAVLGESLARLSIIPMHAERGRPVVGMAGDVYTKTNAAANQDLFRWLEEQGLEVWPSPFQIDLVDFGISRRLSQSVEKLDIRNLLLNGGLAVRRAIHQWRVRNVVGDRVVRQAEPDYQQMKRLTARYMPNEAHELLFINVAKIVDFAERRADGIINAICFNCMVGNASAAIIETIRHDYDNVPIISAVYSGGEDPSRRMALEAFVSQVKAHYARRKLAAAPEASAFSLW